MSKNKAATKVLLQIILFYYVLSMKIFHCMGCIDFERKALTQFKQGLIDPAHRLASWKDGLDCCKWDGVSCDKQTRYVIQLDLRNPYADSYPSSYNFSHMSLGGRVDPALQQLEHLQRLDLSGNSFEFGIRIPDFFGSFQQLRYLNLSFARCQGRVPQFIGNLSTLEVLDLSDSTGANSLSVDNLEWLAKMQSLKQLRMSGVNMTRVNSDWLHVIMSSLPSLRELDLSKCRISYIPQTISLNNFTRLRVLDLSYNNFNSAIPKWVANITSLESIDLTSCYFNGEIPSGFSQLPYLQELRLSFNSLLENCSRIFNGKWESIKIVYLDDNQIYGGLPTYLGNLSKLEYLYMAGLLATKGIQNVLPDSICRLKNLRQLSLENSNLVGSIPTCFGQLSSLEILYLGNDEWIDVNDNQFNDTLREVHFEKLSKLQVLDLSFSGLKLNFKPDWVPPFQLVSISLKSCRFEGDHKFPRWLQTQKSVQDLFLSNTSIFDSIPSWFWNFTTNNNRWIILSHNDIFGLLPNPLMISPKESLDLDLSHNKLSGPIPSILCNHGFFLSIDLSYNGFTGPIPANLVHGEILFLSFLASGNQINGTIPQSLGKMRHLTYLDLSNNDLIGSIPSVCDGQSLELLDLSENQLTGNIPPSLGNCSHMEVLDLRENHLIGSIPSTLGLLRELGSLHLGANNLAEELPLSLANCSSLTCIDLSSNKFVGSIPTWFSHSFPKLEVLSLRSNMFTGKIPPEIPRLGSLQVLDFAQNLLLGPLPQTFQNFQAMRKKQGLHRSMDVGVDNYEYEESLVLTANGKLNEYNKLLSLVVAIDLSDNHFSGEISSELCDLYGLVVLNLSGNHFSGKIPQDIGNLHELLSLDLSRNQLSGQIPSSLSNLTFLQHLNLSHNRLQGMIPSGPQLQTFNDPSIYIDNPDLCGPPLTKNCMEKQTPPISVVHEEQSGKEQHEMLWVYMGLGHGFIVGFCGFFGILVFKRGWRIALFKFFDDKLERIITVGC